MPNTYTKEQIDTAKNIVLRAIRTERPRDLTVDACKILLSALSTAEDQLKRYEWVLAETEALVMSHEGHIAKLEARLLGAGWISVKERLPEDMQRVLVSIYGFTCPTLYTADFIKREIGGIFVPVYDDLTAEHPMSMSQYSISMAEFDIQPSHWMPLPEPPKAAP